MRSREVVVGSAVVVLIAAAAAKASESSPATAHARRGVRVCFSLKGGNANKKTWAVRLSTRAARLSTTLSSRARPAPGRPDARVEDGAAQGGGGALGGLEEVDDAGDRERRVRAGGQHAQARQQVRHVGRAGASGGDKDAGVAEERGRNGEVWAWGWRAHPRPLSLSLSLPFTGSTRRESWSP